jgi:hypothetical protein
MRRRFERMRRRFERMRLEATATMLQRLDAAPKRILSGLVEY